jgi:hypothetical protein
MTIDTKLLTAIPCAIEIGKPVAPPCASSGSTVGPALTPGVLNLGGRWREMNDSTADFPALFAPMKKLNVLKGAIVCSAGPIPR